MDPFGLADPACPCGSGVGHATCCGPLHRGERHAATAEQLMRSRYAAFARGESAYLARTWHPRTRPDGPLLDPRTHWRSLDILETIGGGPDDDRGEVVFHAHYVVDGVPGVVVERSRFVRRRGRWCYVDGTRPEFG